MKIKPIDSTNGSKLIIKNIITCIFKVQGEKDPKIAIERVYYGPGNLAIQVMTPTLSCCNF